MSGGKQAVPRVLADLQKAQVVHVAGTAYGLTLSVASKRQDLADALAARMRLAESCANEACSGAECDPSTHIFQPTQYLLPVNPNPNPKNPVDRLLAEPQDDDVIQVLEETEAEDGHELNPPQDLSLIHI